MSVAEVAPIIEEMASDDRVDVLGELSAAEAAAIIEQLDEEDADEIRQLSVYAPDTAGGLMMTEFASFPMAVSVASAYQPCGSRDRIRVPDRALRVRRRETPQTQGRGPDSRSHFFRLDRKIGSITEPALTVLPRHRLTSSRIFLRHTTSPPYLSSTSAQSTGYRAPARCA